MKTKSLLLLFLIICFNLSAQNIEKIWTGTHNSTVTSVDFLPDGRVISGSYDGTVKLWETNGTASIIYISPFVNGRNLPVESVATDGFYVVAGVDGGLVQKINDSSINIGADVLSVAVKNMHVAAVGRNNAVYYWSSTVAFSSPGTWNYSICFSDSNELIWGSTDGYVRTSWGYYYQDTDWILCVDYLNGKAVSVGLSPYVRVNGNVVYVLPQLGASSININRVNGRLLVSDYSNTIKVISTAGNFLDGVLDKNFQELALVRSAKWSPDGSRIAYGTSDGRVILALPEYSSSSSTTNPPTSLPPKKGKGRK